MIEKWTSYTGYVPLLSAPDARAPKINGININPKTIIEATGRFLGEFEEVVYSDKTGWVKSSYVDKYPRIKPHGLVDFSGMQTPNKYDFAQYLTIFSQPQYNLCGIICASLLAEIPVKTLIDKWQYADLSLFRRIWRWNTSKRATGTSDGDLVKIFAALGYEYKTLTEYKYWRPQLMADLRNAIISVRIDSRGDINGSGVLHWVVLRDVQLHEFGAMVDFYNPATDSVQTRSYQEVVASSRVPYGVIIK